jgi:hypothetical protein
MQTNSFTSRALLIFSGLFLTLAAPQSQAANCPSGATMIRGKCTCPSGKVPSLDGRRCVDPSTKPNTKPAPKKDPKIKGEPAKGDSIPSGAKVRILSLPKEEPFYDIRAQLLGKEGVIYPDPMVKAAAAPKTGAGYYKGIINIDGIEWYFYQVSISILDFGATPAKKTVAYGDFVPEGSKLTLKDVSTSDLTYYKTKLNKLVGQVCTVSIGGLVPNGGSYYSGEVNCDDGKNYYFLGFTFTLDAKAKVTETCDAKAFKGTTPLGLGQRVKILDISSLDGSFADKKTLVGKEGYITSTTTYSTGACWWEGGFKTDDGAQYYFYQAQFQDLGKSAGTACSKDASTTQSLLGGAKVKILEIGPGDPTYTEREKWKGKIGYVSGDLFNMGGCWFDGGIVVDGGAYTYFNQIQIQELAPPPPTPACASDASKAKEIKENIYVTILDIAPSDLYYGERDKWVGKAGKITLSLLSEGTCWYNGEVTFDSGEIRYFAKIQVKEGKSLTPAPTPTNPGGSSSSLSKLKAFTGDSVALGTSVSILDIGNTDIYYDQRNNLLGKSCKVITEEMRTTGASGWFIGHLSCTDGKSYSFAQVAIQLSSGSGEVKATPTPTPTPSTGTKFTGKSIKKGAAVQIVDVASEDIFFGKRDALLGKSCTASAELTSSETGWFTGDLSCGGETYSFFKVALSLSK